MSTEAFTPYPCPLGEVIGHQTEPPAYIVRTPDGRVIGPLANGTPSPENVEADIANPPVDLAAIQRAYDLATERLLNERAGSWGYESMARATTYAQSTNPQWAAEAAALIAHRDAVWLAAYAILADVLAGNRPVPALADYLAELPAMPARPAV